MHEYLSQAGDNPIAGVQHSDGAAKVANHNYQLLYWAVPAEKAPAPPATEAGWVGWDVLRDWIAVVKQNAFAVGGIIHPPTQEGWPVIEVERFEYGPKAEPWIAWKHYVRDEATGELVLLSAKPKVVTFRGAKWVVYLEHRALATREETPPQDNIDKGVCCEMCKRFSLKQGQDWLLQNSHRFDGGEKAQMWVDITSMITQGTPEVEAPDSLQTFGLCLTKQRLVHTYFPGCSEFKMVAKWTPRYKAAIDPSREPQTLVPKPEHG